MLLRMNSENRAIEPRCGPVRHIATLHIASPKRVGSKIGKQRTIDSIGSVEWLRGDASGNASGKAKWTTGVQLEELEELENIT